jgi:L-ascorbate metabolism protein UlaG (beta-lactamase superfamily)
MRSNFDGKRFHNHELVEKSVVRFLKWQFSKKTTNKKWPEYIEPTNTYPKPETRVEGDRLVVTFVNHSTVLIQTQGLNILTDPVWSDRVSPFTWIGPKRIHKPGIAIEDLPYIDVILVSHDHYDHLDIPTLKILQKKFNPHIFSGLGINKVLKKHGLECIEMDWWGSHNFTHEVKIHFVPAKHWSGRKGFYGNNTTLWGGFVIETISGNVFFAGDTGYGQHFEHIKERFEEFRLSLIPIGAYEPRWFMKYMHIDPVEAVLVHQDLNSKYSLAIHFGTFKLSDEGHDQPAQDLNMALKKFKIEKNFFRILDFGENWEVEK